MSDRRLIEEWLPIAALSEESRRERASITALPPTYYLHVWWARRPLIASRAAVLASLLPADADQDTFLRTLGILGDPVAARKKIDAANRKGIRLKGSPYGYRRAFDYRPDEEQRAWLRSEMSRAGTTDPTVLDPTAGGGSIPFEAVRLGFDTYANDLNPVAALLLLATVDWPLKHGAALLPEYDRLSTAFLKRAEELLGDAYPEPVEPGSQDLGFVWARTVVCPYCDGVVPLAPNWKLAPGGVGIRLVTKSGKERRCETRIVSKAGDQSGGTVKSGSATCPFEDCGRVIDGDEVKRQANDDAGGLGEQLVAVAFKRRELKTTKSGRQREGWTRDYRSPRPTDYPATRIEALLADALPRWEALDFIPTETVGSGTKTSELLRYGMRRWTDLFNPRQLLVHGSCVEIFRELLAQEQGAGMSATTEAALGYLSLALDKLLDYNARLSTWDWSSQRVRHVFVRHDFSFSWQYGELPVVGSGEGVSWVLGQVRKCIREFCKLHGVLGTAGDKGQPSLFATEGRVPSVTVTCESGAELSRFGEASVDAVVMDPPYFQNVMYAELSDFFYMWLRRTAGVLVPRLFGLAETDKENEAVANPALFSGEKGAAARAGRDYQEKMAAIFSRCRYVLKADGVLVLMFTHKASGAWDALTKGLVEAGFMITASWPVNTEAESSSHIKNKSAANSTILLVCRPRPHRAADETGWWEEVEPRVRQAVRSRIDSFQEAGIKGVDLYLSAFGPALEEFSRHWPLRRGQPRPQPAARQRKQAELFGEEWDAYAVTPEDALDAARREVKSWRMEQIVGIQRKSELDPVLEFFVLAWDAFEAPRFPYDEALRLARVVGVDLDKEIVGRLCVKKQSNLVMLDAEERAAMGWLGPADGSRTMLDALHHAAWMGRSRTLTAAKELLERASLMDSPALHHALAAVLEVLPPFKLVPEFELDDVVSGAANDFATLEHLRRLCLTGQVREPKQLAMWLS